MARTLNIYQMVTEEYSKESCLLAQAMYDGHIDKTRRAFMFIYKNKVSYVYLIRPTDSEDKPSKIEVLYTRREPENGDLSEKVKNFMALNPSASDFFVTRHRGQEFRKIIEMPTIQELIEITLH